MVISILGVFLQKEDKKKKKKEKVFLQEEHGTYCTESREEKIMGLFSQGALIPGWVTYLASGSYSAQILLNSSRWCGPKMDQSRVR